MWREMWSPTPLFFKFCVSFLNLAAIKLFQEVEANNQQRLSHKLRLSLDKNVSFIKCSMWKFNLVAISISKMHSNAIHFSFSLVDGQFWMLIWYFAKISDAPRCVGEEKQTFGANIGSTVAIKCSVDSYPSPTSFSWGFNNSKDAVKINEGLYEWQGSQSLLHYRTLSDHQFGHLYCWARNKMGVMSQPCIFNIIPATVPESPVNCAVLNQTTDVLEVK